MPKVLSSALMFRSNMYASKLEWATLSLNSRSGVRRGQVLALIDKYRGIERVRERAQAFTDKARQVIGESWGERFADKRDVIPLMPEPIVTQDGSAKNDGERNAAQRFVTKLRRAHPHLKVMVTEDSLRAKAPPIET